MADYGKEVSAAGKTLGSSPYVAWTPVGGEKGTMILVAHHQVKCASKTGTDMFLSFDYGETFIPVDNPLSYSHDPYERCSYSPSLFFSPDGKILYYVNNQPCFDSTYKVSLAKIRIGELS